MDSTIKAIEEDSKTDSPMIKKQVNNKKMNILALLY